MRLKDFQTEVIKNVIAEFDSSAEVRLFGSRADDSKRGGDIDLLVISDKLRYRDKIKILIKLQRILGEQKIDILITKDLTTPFVSTIYPASVLL